ncbi:MAG TPA: hypothetical protein VFA18_18915, partial [Gemmataceae bacterium]|nr:hypothetical protein [Gemmataceae bacterium]
MFLHHLLTSAFSWSRTRRHPRRQPRRRSRWLLQVRALEGRVVPSLIGLAPESVAPDIASEALTDLSYTQVGNNNNPFHYDSIPLLLTLGDGSSYAISKPAGGGSAQTVLNVALDNTGHFSTADAGPDLVITGHVAVGNTTFDGTLLTANVRDFGFSNPNPTDTQFEVRLVVTGGQMTQQPSGLYRVGTDVGLLIHQSGLPISHFPQTFSIHGSPLGSSDLRKLAEVPTNAQPPGGGCGCNQLPPPSSSSSPYGAPNDTAGGTVLPGDGEVVAGTTLLDIPGRGMDWSLQISYRSGILNDGPLGHNWDFNDDRQLVVVAADNLNEVQMSFDEAQVGDVVRLTGTDRGDLYTLNSDGSYTDPNGFFTT